ncbi:hypothetical protein GCM10010404_10040 [Nonomuraea africana]
MMLWVVLTVCLAVNVVAGTVGGGNLLIGLPSGLIAVGCAAGLVALHLKERRS